MPETVGSGPALWEVRAGPATVYLFGTKHILLKPAPWFTPRIREAFDASQELWLELTPDSLAHVWSYAASRGFDPQYDLPQHLPNTLWVRLRPLLVACGIPDATVDHARPWFASILLTGCLARFRAAHGGVPVQSVTLTPDLWLAGRAATQGKTIAGLESGAQQVASLADLPDSVSIAMLQPGAARPAATPQMVLSLLHQDDAWLHGDVQALDRSIVTPMRGETPGVYAALLEQRNIRFADGVASLLGRRITAFVAVGAAHLIGPDSVLALLAARGFRISRIE